MLRLLWTIAYCIHYLNGLLSVHFRNQACLMWTIVYFRQNFAYFTHCAAVFCLMYTLGEIEKKIQTMLYYNAKSKHLSRPQHNFNLQHLKKSATVYRMHSWVALRITHHTIFFAGATGCIARFLTGAFCVPLSSNNFWNGRSQGYFASDTSWDDSNVSDTRSKSALVYLLISRPSLHPTSQK